MEHLQFVVIINVFNVDAVVVVVAGFVLVVVGVLVSAIDVDVLDETKHSTFIVFNYSSKSNFLTSSFFSFEPNFGFSSSLKKKFDRLMMVVRCSRINL